MKSFTRLLTVLLLTNLSVSAAPVRDVPSSHWAKGDVDKLVNEYGFMQGDPNGYFGGNRALTRYEFAKTVSRLVEYYNGEIDSDRKDIENMVSIMELFQKELKNMENKLDTVSQTVQEQNQIITEINELAVTLGEEFESQNNGQVPNQQDIMSAKITRLEYDIDKLQNKGLVVDTLVKGTFNDIKKLGKATARVVSGSRKNVGGPNTKYVAPEPIQTMREEIIPTYVTPLEPQVDAGGIDSMAPPGAQDSGLYNPYDVEIMEDLGQ
jgi:hypothetical protein